MATGGVLAAEGAVPAWSWEPDVTEVVEPELAELVAEVEPGSVDAMTAVPTTPAAPAPRVIADTSTSARLRACFRTPSEAGELILLLRSEVEVCCQSRSLLSMTSGSSALLRSRCVHPLNHLCTGRARRATSRTGQLPDMHGGGGAGMGGSQELGE